MKHFVLWVTGLTGGWMIGSGMIQLSSISFVRSPGSLMMNFLWGALNIAAFGATLIGWKKPTGA